MKGPLNSWRIKHYLYSKRRETTPAAQHHIQGYLNPQSNRSGNLQYWIFRSCAISGFRREKEQNCALLIYYAAISGNFLTSYGLLWRHIVKFGRWKPTFLWDLLPHYFWLEISTVKREVVHSSEQPVPSNELHVLLFKKTHNIHTHVTMPSSGPPWDHVPIDLFCSVSTTFCRTWFPCRIQYFKNINQTRVTALIYAYTTINLGFIWTLLLHFIQQVCSLTYLCHMQYQCSQFGCPG